MASDDIQEVDLLIKHGVVITIDAERRIFADGALAVAGDRIAAVGQSSEVERLYRAKRTIDARGGVVQPGFIDDHVHLSQHLGRGTIPDAWPEEREHDQWFVYWTHMSEDDAYCSTLLACLEMVRNGTTTFCDSGGRFRAEIDAEVAAEVGMRGMLSEVCWDVAPYPEVGVGDTDACLARLERLLETFPKKPDARTWAGVSMAGMGGCSDRLLVEGKELAVRYGVTMDMHQSFGEKDTEAYKVHAGGKSATEYLGELGILGSDLQLVHMIRTEGPEVELLARSGTNVVHCPAASTRVAMGVTHHGHFPEMLTQGVNVALGSDSGNYSDFFDVGRQAYLAATIHREAKEEMPTIAAEQALEMATINGAQALGIGDLTGSLEVGKKADITMHSYCRPEWRPGLDVVNSLIYSAQSTGVDTVIIDGEIVLENGRFTNLDEEEAYRRIDVAARGLYGRMGWEAKDRWPVL